MKNTLLTFTILYGLISGQDYEIENIRPIAHLELGTCNDIWGYTAPDGHEFALVGHNTGTYIFDVSTNPHDPIETGFIPGNNSSWRDLKTYGYYCYVVNESGGGMDIISLEDPFNPYKVGSYTSSTRTAHNMFIADGYAYLVGSAGGAGGTSAWQGIIILELSDPENPTELGRWEETYIHDIFVKNDTAYACDIYNGSLYIIDVSDKTNPTTMVEHNYSNYGCHDVWVTDDSKYAVTSDEENGGYVYIFDIQDFNNINMVATWYPNEPQVQNKSAHNVEIKDDLLYVSYYVYGTRIVDISDPNNPIEVGYYDWYPGQDGLYSGNWGVYPFTENGLIYSADMSGNGFFVMSYPYMGEFEFDEINDTEDNITPINLDVEIDESPDYPIDFSSARLYWGMNGIITDSSALYANNDGDYTGILTPSGADGVMDYYLGFNTTSGERVTKPYGAPYSTFSFNIGADQIPPEVHSISDLSDHFYPSGTFDVYVVATDNFGISAVSLHWQVGESTIQSSECTQIGSSSDFVGALTYVDVEPGSTIRYWAVATDASSTANQSESEEKEFSITDDYIIGDFENAATLNRWDLGAWGRQYVNAELRYALNDSPQSLYEPNADNPCYLIESLDLTYFDHAYLTFISGEMIESGDYGLLQFKRGENGLWQTKLTVNGLDVVEQRYVNLDNYLNENEVYIRLLFTSDENEESIGWFVDDIHLILNQEMPEVGIKDIMMLPDLIVLYPAFPNPFNPVTFIRYNLPQAGLVKLQVYDLMGREIRTLTAGFENAGEKSAIWDAKDNQGNLVSSGVYIYRLEAAGQVQSNKLILLK